GLAYHLVHGHHVGDGQVAVDGSDDPLYRFGYSGWLGRSTHDQLDGAFRAREQREVEGWTRICCRKIARVCDNADDFESSGVGAEDGCDDVLAKRIFTFEVLARQLLADDDFVRALQSIIAVQCAAGNEGYLHGLKVARVGKDCRRVEYLSFGQRRMLPNCEYVVPVAALSRQQRCRRRSLDARNLPDTLEQVIVESH